MSFLHDSAFSISKLEEIESGGELLFDNHANFRNKERYLRKENHCEYSNITNKAYNDLRNIRPVLLF